jgi:hypothetical protein
MFGRTMKMIGVSEIDGGDTELGARICEIFSAALIQCGYNAKYLPLDDEFNCDTNLRLCVVGTKDDLHIEVTHYDSQTSCSKSKLKLSDLTPWINSAIHYLISERALPPPA